MQPFTFLNFLSSLHPFVVASRKKSRQVPGLIAAKLSTKVEKMKIVYVKGLLVSLFKYHRSIINSVSQQEKKIYISHCKLKFLGETGNGFSISKFNI